MKRKIFTLILSVVCFGFVAKAVVPDIYLTGTFNSWAVADPLYKLVDNGNSVLHIETQLAAGTHQFKLTDGTWDKSIEVSRTITLTTPAKINIYARGTKWFVCDTQDTLFMTGNAIGSFAWGSENMVPMTIKDKQATALTTIQDWGQGNIYRKKTGTATPNNPYWQEQVWTTPDFVQANYILNETTGATRTVVFDFATYTMTLKELERFDLGYTLDGVEWKSIPFQDVTSNADQLVINMTLPADFTAAQCCVKYSQDGFTYPANINGFTSVVNFSSFQGITAGAVKFEIKRSSENPNWDMKLATNTALKDLLNSKLTYSVNNKQITVKADNSSVELYTIAGQLLVNSVVKETSTFTVKQSGVYLLRSNGASYKVIIK